MVVRMNIVQQLLLCTPMLVAACTVWAENLKDPTRPPVLYAPKASAAAPVLPVEALRSIRIDGRGNLAIVGGTVVKVGDSVGEAKVKAIRPYEVVLATSAGDRILKLYPGVDKHVHEKRLDTNAKVARAHKSTQVATTGERAP